MTALVPNKLTNIQSLRGLAALLVVFTHLPSMEVKHGGDHILPAFTRLGISGVDMFFVISGFIMVYVTWNQSRNIKNSLSFLFARVTRIYPIYWAVALIVFFGWLIRPSLISFDPSQTSVIKSFFLWPDQTLPMLKVAWTLIHELYFYIIFTVALLFPKKALLPALTIWIGLVVIGNLLLGKVQSPELTLITHPLSLEFFFGALAGWVYKKYGAIGGWPILGVGVFLYVVGLYYLTSTFGETKLPGNWERVLYFGLPTVLIVYGLVSVEARGFRLPGWSSKLGDWSYSLYLSHILTLSVIGLLWRPFARPGMTDNVIAICIMLVASIVVSAVLWMLIEKPALTLFKKLRVKLFPRRPSAAPTGI